MGDGDKLNLNLISVNGKRIGAPNAGKNMLHLSAAGRACRRTRRLGAGMILGAGNGGHEDESAGSSCIAELRANEEMEHGKASTPFLKFGDRVRIEILDESGETIFGAIDQKVVKG